MLDSKLVELLKDLRRRVRRYIVWDSLLAILAVVLGVFWVALAIDYLPVRIGGSEMPRSARAILLCLTAAAVAFLVWRQLLGRLHRDLPDDSLALLIERQHPELGGRLVTAVQLNQSGRQHDAHSEVLLNRVHHEVIRETQKVDVSRVFRWQPIRDKLLLVMPLLLAAATMAIASPSTFARAVSRLTLLSNRPWPRQASLEMIGVEVPTIRASEEDEGATELVPFDNKLIRLARGSNTTLRIRAAGEDLGHQVPEFCTVTYVDDDGNRGQSNLRRVGRLQDGFQSFVLDGPPLASLAQSVTLSIRGLDDRLNDYRIEAVDPPAIAELKLQLRDPGYLRVVSTDEVTFDRELSYQAGVRVREGSDLTVAAATTKPIGEVEVVVSTDDAEQSARTIDVQPKQDANGFQFQLPDVRDATAIRIVPKDPSGISAQAPYRYFIGIVRDQLPETSLELSGIGSVITPIAMLPVKATATDDYGVHDMKLSLDLSGQSADGADETNLDVYDVHPSLDRDGVAEVEMDLRQLSDDGSLPELKPGMAVTLTTEVSDHYDLSDPHLVQAERIRLQVVTPEDLLATLERRELEFRSRLEQAIEETRRLKQNLSRVVDEANAVSESEDADSEDVRQRQRVQLRIRQADLQASKTSDELSGIVSGLDDLLLEMVNNRVDSVDRRNRLQASVRDPLAESVRTEFPQLREHITEMERLLMGQANSPDLAAREQAIAQSVQAAVQTSDEILLRLAAVLEKMLDLESFNEILDMVRGLIDDQEDLIDETEKKQKQSVLDLFK